MTSSQKPDFCVSIREMKAKGYLNPVVVPLVMSIILVLVLGFTTFKYYNDYTKQKNEVDAIVAKSVEEAKAAQAEELEAKHAEEMKNPLETFTAPSQAHAVAVTYPRTWSSHVVAKDTGNLVLDGYFHPGTVPDTRGGERFALRMTLERKDYAREVESYQRDVEDGTLSASGITVNQIKGVRLTGTLDKDINGVMVILPLRDKVLKVWTEANVFAKDFNDIIIKNLTFDR